MWAGWLDGNNWNCTSTTFPPVESRGPSLAGRPALIAITRDVWCGYYRADKEVVGRGRANTPHLFLSHISTLIVCYVDEGGSYNLTQCRKSMPSLTDGRTTAGHRRDWRWVKCERVKSRFWRDSIIFSFYSFYLKESFWLITRVKRIKCK